MVLPWVKDFKVEKKSTDSVKRVLYLQVLSYVMLGEGRSELKVFWFQKAGI